MGQNFHFPTLEYLKFGNVFSSSLGGFNFKFFPNAADCKTKVVVWVGENCLDFSEVLFEKVFELSEDGLKEAVSWVNSNYENIKL